VHLDHLQRVERQEHVEIDVGHNIPERHGGMRGEIARAQFALFFRRDREENHRALQLELTLLEQARHFDDGGDSRSVVHGAVIDAVAVHRAAHADVVQMRREDDIFVLQLAASRRHAGQIGRFQRVVFEDGLRAQRSGKRKMRQRFVIARQCLDFGERMARSGEEFVRATGRDADRDTHSGGFRKVRIGQTNGGLRRAASTTAAARSTPGRGCVSAIGAAASAGHDGGDADRAGIVQYPPPFRRGSEVRLHRRRRFGGARTVHIDGNLALQVEPGELIPMGLGNHQPVAHEHHGSFELGRKFGARTQRGVGAEGERLLFAVADQREAGLFLHQQARVELDGLPIAGGARGLEAELPELAGYVIHRLEKFRGADIAALQFVVGEELDVRPPEFPFGGVVHHGCQEWRRGENEEDRFLERQHDPYRNIT